MLLSQCNYFTWRGSINICGFLFSWCWIIHWEIFQIFKINIVYISFCFPSNQSKIVFHVNVNYLSLVWPLITMIFNKNMIANFSDLLQIILFFALCVSSSLLPNWAWLFNRKPSLQGIYFHHVSNLLLQLCHNFDQEWQDKINH